MQNDLFLRACLRQPTERAPVWYMRQAGRYDPEYRALKQKYSLLELCANPELAATVTLMPVRKLGVDAAILYSDIMNPVASLGIAFDIVANVGPVIHTPIRSMADVQALRPVDVEGDLGHILATIRLLRTSLEVPLITFAGAPFTLASYLIEGRPTKRYLLTKGMMYRAPDVWDALMNKLVAMTVAYLRAHVAHGAQAIQLFDSWAGSLSPVDYERYVLPAVRTIFTELRDVPCPKIYFPGVASGELLGLLRDVPFDVVGLDWRIPIAEARTRIGGQKAIQGNLDPVLLEAPETVLFAQARRLIEEGQKNPGYIFNLGHGLYPEASLETLQALTAWVQSLSIKTSGS